MTDTHDTITVRTDQGALQVPAGTTLAGLLARLRPDQDGPGEPFATAVNGDFVARSARAGRILQEGDTVLCFAAITGG